MVGFRRPHRDLPVHSHRIFLDGDALARQVDIPNAERDHLAPSKTGVCEEPHVEPLIAARQRETLYLRMGQILTTLANLAGELNVLRGVDRDEPAIVNQVLSTR